MRPLFLKIGGSQITVMKRLKKPLKVIIIIAAVMVLLISPPMRGLWSMAVMGIYSGINHRDSVLTEEGVDISIPGGLSTSERDWYPFVMTFNSDRGFSNYIHKPGCRLTIMYNFPSFDLLKGCSRLYDEESPLYSSFYGAYAVKTDDGESYGFIKTEDGLILDESITALVPNYDYHRLVLRDFGLTDDIAEFEWRITDRSEKLEYAGFEGWTSIDAELYVNGCAHEPDGFVQSYLQYGSCNFETASPLAPTRMYGRVYCRYFEQKEMSIFLYVLTSDKAELERCDEEILSKSMIELNN